MLVSGGQILAIDKVNTKETIIGDGVNKPLGVNTDLIATNSGVSSVSAALEQQIDAVSSKFNDYYPKTATSAAAEISAAFDKFKTTQTIVSAGKHVGVHSAYNEAGAIVYTVSADAAERGEVKIVGDDGIRVSYDNTVSAWNIGVSANYQSAGNYVSADDFEDYKEKVEQEFENTSAWANKTFQPIGEYISASEKFLSANSLDDLSGKWESVYDTTVTASGNWNEASAFAANSAKFVTSAGVVFDTALAYFLKKSEEKVAWSGVDLSNLGKMYNISTLTPDLISAGISADAQNNPFYVISAAKHKEVEIPRILGEHGVSAHYAAEENTYVIGLDSNQAYASFTATTTEVDGVYTPAIYSESYNVGSGVTLEDNTISVGSGLWHVTIYAKVTNAEVSPEYYDTMLICNSIKNIVQFDNSYIHTEYINLDTDIVSDDNLAINIELEDVPANSTVVIEQLQLHKIVTGSVTHEGGNTYTPGNGISIDNYKVDFNTGKGLGIDDITNNVDVQAGSGIFIDANDKLSIKLGRGLAFSANGDVIAIETDNAVNNVVEIVETLKKELDGKLTTNMNISDAKKAGCPWDGDTTNNNNIAASFFTIPLQHSLTTASEISFFTTQGLGQSDSAPLIIGILEYNFDYFEADSSAPNGVKTRSQTQWIADTGPIWDDTPDVNGSYLKNNAGRYTYKLKNVTPVSACDVTGNDGTVYHNEFGPSLRSDRAYYMVLYCYSPNSYQNFLCDEGYGTGINNTNPAISFRKTGTNYTDADGITREITRSWLAAVKENDYPFSISGMQYWDRANNAVNEMKRPYIMIRNPRL